MVTQLAKRRGGRGLYRKSTAVQPHAEGKRFTLPAYLERAEVDALILGAESPTARLLLLLQWRAGLRVSEATELEWSDLSLDADRPSLRVRAGKGNRSRTVPVHPELRAALELVQAYRGRERRIIPNSRSTGWRWVKGAQQRAEALGALPKGKRIGTHTLRHSAARHWLAHGVPINVVSLWLGHASIQTTLIYLRLLPDPAGYIERVP